LHIEADNFIRSKTKQRYKGFENWEHKDSVNFKRLIEVIRKLKNNKTAMVPICPGDKSRKVLVKPKPIILIDGYLLFVNHHLIGLMDKRIFVDVSDRTIRVRRIGRKYHPSVDSKEYLEKVLIPFSRKYLQEQRKRADLIVSGEDPQGVILERIRQNINI